MAVLGKELSNFHCNFENIEKYRDIDIQENLSSDIAPILKVVKNEDLNSAEIILDNVTKIAYIPLESFDYQIGNRSPIDWLLSQHKIKNPSLKDRNNYGKVFELFNTPEQQLERYQKISRKYLIDVIPRLITVSLQTIKIKEKIKKCNVLMA